MPVGKALVIDEHGGIDKFHLVSDFAFPEPKAGELLVHVAAASVNPVDTYVRSGAYPAKSFPLILGGDVAGTVVQAGDGCSFKAGDKVYCCSSTYVAQTPELQGTYAEYCILKDSWVALAPSTLTLVDAAAVPLVALTAVQALDKAESSPGQRILITGASGGVGHIAVQLAKLDYKLHVTAAASAKHREWMRALGADEVVDYTVGIQQCLAPFTGNKFDIILDVIGGEFLDYATKNVLKEGGIVSEVMNRGTGESDVAKEQGAGVRFATTLIQPNGAQLKHLAEHIDAGKLKVKVAQRYPLEQAGAAQEEVLAGHAGGKVVLTI